MAAKKRKSAKPKAKPRQPKIGIKYSKDPGHWRRLSPVERCALAIE